MRARSPGCICPPDLPVCGCGRVAEGALLAGKAQRPEPGRARTATRARARRACAACAGWSPREHPRRRPRAAATSRAAPGRGAASAEPRRRAAPAPQPRTRPRAVPRAAPRRAARPRTRVRLGRLVIPLIALLLGGIVFVNVAKLTLTNRPARSSSSAQRRVGDRPPAERARAAQRAVVRRAAQRRLGMAVAERRRGHLPRRRQEPGRRDPLGRGAATLAAARPPAPPHARGRPPGPVGGVRRPRAGAAADPDAGGRRCAAAGAAGAAGDLPRHRAGRRPVRAPRRAQPLHRSSCRPSAAPS